MKHKKSIKKMAAGGTSKMPYPIKEILGSKPTKTKTKSVSEDGNYKYKEVTKKYSSPELMGTKEKFKTRRTAKGILKGAEPGEVRKTKNIIKNSERTGIVPRSKYGGTTKNK
jgi:hypothetical protein